MFYILVYDIIYFVVNLYMENRWINDYIKNIDLENIEWIKLNCDELDSFLEQNYLDKNEWEYVYDENADNIYPTLLGMTYLNFNNTINNKSYSFLLGVVNNNINKKTVVCATIYIDEYFMFEEQTIPVTYISSMEVNSYFRNKGLYKKMCEALINFINPNQHIIATKQSKMGIKYNTFKILSNILISHGFEKRIFEDNYGLINSELYDVVCSKLRK